MHRSEFKHEEWFPCSSDPFLPEKYRSFGSGFYQNGYDNEERLEKNNTKHGSDYVNRSFPDTGGKNELRFTGSYVYLLFYCGIFRFFTRSGNQIAGN
jgi:hypothetical protein